MLVFRVRNYCLYQNSCLIKNKKQQQKKRGQNRQSQRIRKRQQEPYYLLPRPTTVTLMIKLPPYFFVQWSATSLNAFLASALEQSCFVHSKCLLLCPFMIYFRFHQIYIGRHLVIHQLFQRCFHLIHHGYFINLFYSICFRVSLEVIS